MTNQFDSLTSALTTNAYQGRERMTSSGLKLAELIIGTGPEASIGETVSVHYRLFTEDGQEFDSSYGRSDGFNFPLGNGRVIRGFDEGVAGMKAGGKRVLIIPPELGYGSRGAGGVIPPNATLIMEVELIAVNGVEASHATAYSEGFEQSGLNALTQSAVSDTSIEALESSPEVSMTNQFDSLTGSFVADAYQGDLAWGTVLADKDWLMMIEARFGLPHRNRYETYQAFNDEGYNSLAQPSVSDTSIEALESSPEVSQALSNETSLIEASSEGYWGDSKLSVAIRLRDALIKESVNGATPKNGSNYDDDMNGQAGTDVMQGLNGHDYINGHGGNDFLAGGEGNDYMVGGNGHDWLLGGQDDDLITGGDGNDFLAGGEGVNHLKGGDGFDLFVLDKGGVAMIHDFTLGEDKIFLGDNRLFPGEVNNLQFGSYAGFASLIDGDSDKVVAVVNNFTQDQLQAVSDHVFI